MNASPTNHKDLLCIGFFIIALAICLPYVSVVEAAAPKPGINSPFEITVGKLFDDAGIGTDEQFDAYKKKENLVGRFVAPQGFRKLMRNKGVETRSRVHCRFDWGREHVSLEWSGTLQITGKYDDVKRRLPTLLVELGYQHAPKKLKTYVKAEYELRLQKAQRFGGKTPGWAMVKDSGAVREELILVDLARNVGGRGPTTCSCRFVWCASTPSTGPPQPTLENLLSAIPSLQPEHFEPKLYARLKSEPIHRYRVDCLSHRPGKAPNMGWAVAISAATQKDVERTLTEAGFLPGRKIDLPARGSLPKRKQHTWSRKEDYLHASIVTSPKGDRIEVLCQAPQRP